MVAHKLGDDLGLADPGIAVKEQAWHAVARRISQEIAEPIQRPLGHREIDPAVAADPFGTGRVALTCPIAVRRMQMVEVHDHSSTA
jgi:hypothetical protein